MHTELHLLTSLVFASRHTPTLAAVAPTHGLSPVSALVYAQNKELLTQERARMEFKRAGQTGLIRHRAWPDVHADQPTIYPQPALLTCLPLYFPTLVPPQIT